MENENVKQVDETLKKKECIVTEKVSDVCERYWTESEKKLENRGDEMKKYVCLLVLSSIFFWLNVVYPKCMGEHIWITNLEYSYHSQDGEKKRSQYFNKIKYKENWEEQGFDLQNITDSLSVKGTILKYKEEYSVTDGVMRIYYKDMMFVLDIDEEDSVHLFTKTQSYEDIFKSQNTMKKIENETGISLEDAKEYVELKMQHYRNNLNKISEKDYSKVKGKMKETLFFILLLWCFLWGVSYVKKKWGNRKKIV